jgi:hypothetical protein
VKITSIPNATKQNTINRKTKKIGGLGWLNLDPFESYSM